jgi:UDP-N-acetylmuramate dehydrogenase
VVEPLSARTTLCLGGPPWRWIHADAEALLIEALGDLGGEEALILGGGSNLLVADEGFPGTVIRLDGAGVETASRGSDLVLSVWAGHDWEDLARMASIEGWAGIECLNGIPGTVGALPIQNVGAYGQCARQIVESVKVYDRLRGTTTDLSNAQCEFGHRSSVFKRDPGRYAVLCVRLRLTRSHSSKPIRGRAVAERLGVKIGARAPLEDVREAVMEIRQEKGMVLDPDDADTRSAGSFFLNPNIKKAALDELVRDFPQAADEKTGLPAKKLPNGQVRVAAAWLIEHAGFARGHGDPYGIALSTKHVLAITNRGSGSAAEAVPSLARLRRRSRPSSGSRCTRSPNSSTLAGVPSEPRLLQLPGG